MKKGIYYVPLFLMMLVIMGGSYYIDNYLSLANSVIAMLLLCEVYYLRFLK
jgi:hypothetical protein